MAFFEWAGYGLIAIYVAFFVGTIASHTVMEQWPWFVLGYAIAFHGLLGMRRLWEAFLERRELIGFRSMTPAQQEEFLKKIWPSSLRYEYLRRIDADEQHEVEGNVERFRFPKAERRLHRQLFVMLLVILSGLCVVALLPTKLPLAIRLTVVVLGAIVVCPVSWLLGRLSLLHTTLEIDPFGVAIHGASVHRGRLAFNQPLFLINHQAKGYFELIAPIQHRSLRIHHARIASLRAHELISKYGGMSPIAEEPGP